MTYSYDTVDPWWQPDFSATVRDPANFDRRWVSGTGPDSPYTSELRANLAGGTPKFETMLGKPEWAKTGRIGHIYLIIHKRSNKIYVGQTLVGTTKRLQRHIADAEKDSKWPVHQFIRDMPREGLLCIAYKTVCLPALSQSCDQLKVWSKMMTVVETEIIQEFTRKMPHRLLNLKGRNSSAPRSPKDKDVCNVKKDVSGSSIAAKSVLEQALKQSDPEVMRALIQSALTLF